MLVQTNLVLCYSDTVGHSPAKQNSCDPTNLRALDSEEEEESLPPLFTDEEWEIYGKNGGWFFHPEVGGDKDSCITKFRRTRNKLPAPWNEV